MMSFPLPASYNPTLARVTQGTESGPQPYISNLPTELLGRIVFFLPPPSAALFSITSHEFMKALGTVHIEQCQNNSPQGRVHKQDMLEMLSHDFDSLIACVHCQKLHPVSLIPADRSGTMNRQCETVELALHVHNYLHPGFRLTSIQMATKLSTTGKDPTLYLKSMSRTIRDYHLVSGHITYLMHETRVCGEDAIFRSQVWTLIPRSDLAENDVGAKTHGFVSSNFRLCPHMYSHGMKEVRRAYLCHCKHLQECSRWCSSCSMMRKCGLCHIEFHVGSKDYGVKGVAIVVTKWSNLGCVRNTKDPKTLALLHGVSASQAVPNGTLGLNMRAFEGIKAAEFVPTLTSEQEEAFLLPVSKWY